MWGSSSLRRATVSRPSNRLAPRSTTMTEPSQLQEIADLLDKQALSACCWPATSSGIVRDAFIAEGLQCGVVRPAPH